eukprot:scaffold275264_cov39-Tisochrysis_lutea.AAC.5
MRRGTDGRVRGTHSTSRTRDSHAWRGRVKAQIGREDKGERARERMRTCGSEEGAGKGWARALSPVKSAASACSATASPL